MRSKSSKRCFPVLVIVSVILATAGAASAQTSSFTYQGRLTDGGTAANGNYDLQFALFDSLSGGTQVGSTQTLNTVAVSNGVFTVSLDFGANAFPGANRFLEISARPSTGGAFTLLSPRQQITSTPYAVRSLNASSADSVPASGVSAGSGNYIQNSTSPQSGSNFNISGNGTAGGTLSGGVVNATTQYNLNGARVLSGAANLGNLYLGALAGEAADLSAGFGSSNTIVGVQAGQQTRGEANSFFGYAAGIRDTGGFANTAIGSAADVGSGNLSNATAIGACALVTQSDSLILGSTRDGRSFCNSELLRETNVGIGTTAPQRLLHIRGTGSNGLGRGDLLVTSTGTVGSAITLEATPSGGGTFSWISTGTGAFPGAGLLAAFDVNAGAYRIVIDSGGNVGIGTTSPTALLSVNGTANKPGGGSWSTFSDERLKNIRGRFTPGLKAVMQLQPLRYEYKRDNALALKSDGEHVGFSAQAVQKIIPEAVTTNDKGYLLVNNDPILWTMLNAIKEQQAQIQQQRELIERQQARTNRQQQQLNALKKLVCHSHWRRAACR